MALRRRVAGFSLIASLLVSSSAAAASAAASFEEATRRDLAGEPRLAFADYLRAAEAGLPKAEFNVAVMLDSGRGVTSNPTQAATWYARAAAHGLPRAAYNLGQLYESGLGVPRNAELAQAWFEASKLPASNEHRSRTRPEVVDGQSRPTPPDLVAPTADGTISSENGGVELVWTVKTQPAPAQYYVELHSISKTGSREEFSVITKLSSVFVKVSEREGNYAWRVSTLTKDSGQYAASTWGNFRVE